MATPTENWPKPWMLQLHEQAVEHGFVWVEPISEEDAKSLRDRLYRMRRRSDKSMAAFIRPEYHLVMVGVWEPGFTGAGRLPLIYDRRSDGQPLPKIIPATQDEVERYSAPAMVDPIPILPPHVDLTPETLEIKPSEIGGFVDSLIKKAKGNAD